MPKIIPIPLTSKNSATVGAGYTTLGSMLPKACQLMRIYNSSNQDITLSFDGMHDNDVIEAGTTLQLTADIDPTIVVAAGTQFFVKGTAGVGFIYLSGYYLS